jgi:glucose/arabinose dehydrogenase
MAFAPDGRIFITQQGGALRIIQNGSLLATPAITLTVDPSGERGLLGLAFDPDFATNNFIYLYYTRTSTPRNNRVSRFTLSGNTISPSTELVLLDLAPLTSATNHNGGALHFNNDGKLYIAVGDNATGSNAPSLNTIHGKMLRMNKDGSIPTDNPFFTTTAGNNRLIWTTGLRNPFTFSVQETTGRIFINDVGQNNWEEINDGIAGANYGWPTTEGATTNPAFRGPVYTYNHANQFGGGFSCAITGGDFYNPANNSFPASYTGRYFFADYCGGWIATYDPATSTTAPFLTGANSIVDIRTNPDGSLYYLERGNNGRLMRIAYTGPLAPTISTHPQNQSVPTGLNATFTVVANGSNLSYQWQRNTIDIPSATSAAYTLNNVSLGDSGAQFRVIVTNPTGSATSNPATLTVTTNQPPVPSITAPATFIGAQTINFSGAATDPESGTLAPSALRWRVDYHTGAAVRPFVQEFTGATGGSWLVPQVTPYTLTNVFFRIYLTATDPQGNSTTVTRDVAPQVATLTMQTNPSGLLFTIDGQPATAPQSFPAVVNLIRPIGTSTPQGSGATRYNFLNWSDGGPITHDITVPATNTTYTANFQTQYQLTTSVNPPSAGTITPTAFYNANSIVNLIATPATGWQFNNFTGPANGATVTMDAPKTITANFTPYPGMLALTIQSKTGSGQQRIWTLNITNLGQGPVINARLNSIAITPIGTAQISVATPLPLALGNIAPGASISIPVTLNWPLSTPPTRARMVFSLSGDFNHASTVTLNNLFR